VLFHLEFSPGEPGEVFDLVSENFGCEEAAVPFSRDLVMGVWENREILDRLIGEASRHWRVERMSRLDRSILRIAAYEIRFVEDIPPRVSIDEAVELAKIYGGDASWRFVNGVLDHIYNAHMEDASTSDG
ncbi:MAG: transcription antitermination factor NusB, partial [Deltaproteobacteria bacterium]